MINFSLSKLFNTTNKKKLDFQLELFKKESSFGMNVDLSDKIMRVVSALPEFSVNKTSQVSNFKWIMVGFIVFFSIPLLPFSDTFEWAKNFFGANLEVPVAILLGLWTTIYSLIYVGTHLENLKKNTDFYVSKIINWL